MIESNANGLSCYRFAHLSRFPEIAHAIFTRHGGSSRSPFDSLNVGYRVGDERETVTHNRKTVAQALDGINPFYISQVHGTEVAVLSEGSEEIKSGDAMATSIHGVGLAIQTADCQAIMLYDPVRKVVANVHSGWRGSVGNIAAHTVRRMQQQWGCRAADILAGIGPSLGPCCAEFVHYRKEIPEPLWRYRRAEAHFDFWQMSSDQLVAAGLDKDAIQIGGICTRCNSDLFFSYRATKTTGRCVSVIGLRKQA